MKSWIWWSAVCVVVLSRAKANAQDQGPLPTEAAKTALTIPDDLELDQVLSEPAVRQPVSMTFDERGRLWVVQYLQYPFPAGLKILSEDKFLRATYDKVPAPPPNHFRGEDKITIHEDTDGDGTFDRQTTFVEGLSIVTSVAFGRGGVWVLNPPYLLFYPDKNRDDVPDGDPEVHLAGFGLEDTHSCASCLQWGPDGWLYAAQGSTVSGDIIRPGLDKTPVHSMGQLIWRYHPETRKYEIFAEGGGNAWGVEFDDQGRVFSGHNGGDTRGFHYVQGGYFQKGFSKHGPLSNPYTFGYFPPMQHHSVPRFTHTFVIYGGGALPPDYNGKLIGVAPLQSHVVMSEMSRDGSTFKTKDVGYMVTSSDPWFRPVDIRVGPDGAIYVADMYEGQIAHLRHHEGKVDKSNGRIYRIRSKGAVPHATRDLGALPTAELLPLLKHPNRWYRRTAIRLLYDRRDVSVVEDLLSLVGESTGNLALEALFALNACGGFTESSAAQTLCHADPFVRGWTVRLLGDRGAMSSDRASQLAQLGMTETNVDVRSQLASTARRLPAEQGLPIVRSLLTHDEDVQDPHLPLLLWWAIEAKADSDRDAVLAMFEDSQVCRLPMASTHILHRLMRRFAMGTTRKDLLTCAKLFNISPDAERNQQFLKGFEEAFQGRPLADLPIELAEALNAVGGKSPLLALRQGEPAAVETALATIANGQADRQDRLQFVQVFGEVRRPECVGALLDLVDSSADDVLRMAALTSLQPYDDPQIPARVLKAYGAFTEDARSAAQTLLASRKAWALALVQAIDGGMIDASTIPLDVVRKLTIHRDDQLLALVSKHWGKVTGATTEEMRQVIDRLASTVREGKGDPYGGKKLFTATCAKCHKLHGQGGQIGPDLTTYKRDDVPNMLVNIVNPSAEIREGFETFQVLTDDGRIVTGFLVDKDNQVVVVRGVDGQNITFTQDQIDDMSPLKTSLMPEGVLKDLNDQQVRDLFAYLRSTQPLND